MWNSKTARCNKFLNDGCFRWNSLIGVTILACWILPSLGIGHSIHPVTMTTKNMPQHSQILLGDSTSPVENTSMVSSNSKWSTGSRAMWEQQLRLPRPSTWRGGGWVGGAPGVERTEAAQGSHSSTRVRSWTSKLCRFVKLVLYNFLSRL